MINNLITSARVINGILLITLCNSETLKIPFDSLSVLKRIPVEERPNFTLSEDGSYLYWEASDVHLDLDAFRSVVNPKYQQKCTTQKLKHDQAFKKAIAAFMSDNLEINSKNLELLAKAHGMELKDYLNAIASSIPCLYIDLD